MFASIQLCPAGRARGRCRAGDSNFLRCSLTPIRPCRLGLGAGSPVPRCVWPVQSSLFINSTQSPPRRHRSRGAHNLAAGGSQGAAEPPAPSSSRTSQAPPRVHIRPREATQVLSCEGLKELPAAASERLAPLLSPRPWPVRPMSRGRCPIRRRCPPRTFLSRPPALSTAAAQPSVTAASHGRQTEYGGTPATQPRSHGDHGNARPASRRRRF